MAQMPAAGPSFYGRVTFSGFSAGGTGDYVGDLTNFVSQTGHGWILTNLALPAGIVSPNGSIYEIIAINSANVISANVDIRFVQGTNIAPFGNGYAGALVGPLGLMPFSTTNSGGITAKMQAEIENYNKNRFASFSGGSFSEIDCEQIFLEADTVPNPNSLTIHSRGFSLVSYDVNNNLVYANGSDKNGPAIGYAIGVKGDSLIITSGGKFCVPHGLPLIAYFYSGSGPDSIATAPADSISDPVGIAYSDSTIQLNNLRAWDPSVLSGGLSGGGSSFTCADLNACSLEDLNTDSISINQVFFKDGNGNITGIDTSLFSSAAQFTCSDLGACTIEDLNTSSISVNQVFFKDGNGNIVGIDTSFFGGPGGTDMHITNFVKGTDPLIDSLFITRSDGQIFGVELDTIRDYISSVVVMQGEPCDTTVYTFISGKLSATITCSYPPRLECLDTLVATGVPLPVNGDPIKLTGSGQCQIAVYPEQPDGFVIEQNVAGVTNGVIGMFCGKVDINNIPNSQSYWANVADNSGDSTWFFTTNGLEIETPNSTQYPMYDIKGDGTGFEILSRAPHHQASAVSAISLFDENKTLGADRSHNMQTNNYLFTGPDSYEQGYYNSGSAYGFRAENEASAINRFRFGVGYDGFFNFFRLYTIDAGKYNGVEWNGSTLIIGTDYLGATGAHIEFNTDDLLIHEIRSYPSTGDAASDGTLPSNAVFKVTNGNGTSSLHVKD